MSEDKPIINEDDQHHIFQFEPSPFITVMISKVVRNGKETGDMCITSDPVTINKAKELLLFFGGVPIENIRQCLQTSAGQLAVEVLTTCIKEGQYSELTPLLLLVDELKERLDSVQYNKDYVHRSKLLIELEEILKVKSITPYRRQRINRALKRECLRCLGCGKVGEKISETKELFGFGSRRKIKVGVTQDSPDCPTCSGTGIRPKKEESNVRTQQLDEIKEPE